MDGRTISVTLHTADSGLITLNLPVSLSGHLIRILTARTREAHERLRKSGENIEFASDIANVKTLSLGGAQKYPHPILSLETRDGVVTAYQVPANILQTARCRAHPAVLGQGQAPREKAITSARKVRAVSAGPMRHVAALKPEVQESPQDVHGKIGFSIGTRADEAR